MDTISIIAIAFVVVLAIVCIVFMNRASKATMLLESEKQIHAADNQRSAEVLQATKADYEKRLKEVKDDAEQQREKGFTALKTSYDEQLKLFREQVTTATEKLLKDRSAELQSTNVQQIDTILKPIKENIFTMQKSMDDNKNAHIKATSSFEQAMKDMMQQTMTIGESADRLSNALQHKNKTAGNWGELVLTELLESQGLQKGVHFEVQQTLRDSEGRTALHEESGSRMIPDVILHLADNRDVVVDSKVSLTAFVEYMNADDDATRKDAAQRHIVSIKNHINELMKKEYSKYIAPPRQSVDFVILFVPNEGALQLIMSLEPKLWREALEKKVFIAGSQTLAAALRIIDLTWVSVKQNENTQKVMDEARKLIDRVNQFYDAFKSVGDKIDAASKEYKKVTDKVKDGSQSILGAGHRLEELGVRGKNQLPTFDEE